MKQIVFAAALLLSAVSFAKTQTLTGVTEFKVVSAKFAESHAAQPGDATVTVDYSKSQVRLFVTREHNCPPNMMCAMFMPAPLIAELPITSLQTDSCGIHTIVAQKDSRPVDGSLEVLTVKDASQMTCKTLVAVNSEAQYKTTFTDRRNGKTVNDLSTMTLAAVLSDKAVVKTILKYQQSSGFSPRPSTRVVTVDSKGKVSSLETFFQDNTQNQVEIAQLSAAALKNLKTQIASVKADTQLVDENENQPKCMDAPSSTISIVNDQKEVAIYSWESCHTYKSYDGQAANLSSLMLGFATLSR